MNGYRCFAMLAILAAATMIAVFSEEGGAMEGGQPSAGGAIQPAGESLGEAKIVVYAKGTRITLDSRSPHFRELQRACEELIIHSFREKIPPEKASDKDLTAEAVRSKEWGIELTYTKPVPQEKLGFIGKSPRLFPLTQFLIPLTGPGVGMRSGQTLCTVMFPFELVVSRDKRPELVDWTRTNSYRVATNKSVDPIKVILRRLKISVP